MAVICCVQAKDLVPTPMSQLEPTLVNNATLAAASSALASVARGPHVSAGSAVAALLSLLCCRCSAVAALLSLLCCRCSAVAAVLAARFASTPPALHMCSCLLASLIRTWISVLGLRPGGG
jgi:hypothetical protein